MRNEDYFFDDWEGNTTEEICPGCDLTQEVTVDGKSTCKECGRKNILPCSACKVFYNYPLTCGWWGGRCNAFPEGVE